MALRPMLHRSGQLELRITACIVCAALLCSCAARPAPRSGDTPPSAQQGTPVEPITSTDPCAMRLHELAGALLLHFLTHNTLPQELSQLTASAEMGAELELVCPVSQRPYGYNPTGIYMAERGEYVIVHDPAPSHAGMRWAITIEEPLPGRPLVAKVIALPESFFVLRPPM